MDGGWAKQTMEGRGGDVIRLRGKSMRKGPPAVVWLLACLAVKIPLWEA